MLIHDVVIVPTITTSHNVTAGSGIHENAGVGPQAAAETYVGEAVSIGLVAEDGRVFWGDCMGVAHAAVSGRDPVFRWENGLPAAREVLRPALLGRDVQGFRLLCGLVDSLRMARARPLHRALRYGAT